MGALAFVLLLWLLPLAGGALAIRLTTRDDGFAYTITGLREGSTLCAVREVSGAPHEVYRITVNR